MTALSLGQAGIKTLVIERHTELLFSTRACAYQPVVIKALEAWGILDLFKQHGYFNTDGIHWRDMAGNELGHVKVPEGEYILLIGQKKVNDLLLKEIEKYSSVEVRFNTAYVGCEQDDKQVKLMAHETTDARDNDICITADWLVGADGASSAVRRSLCIPFEGMTFTDDPIVGTDVYYDFTVDGYAIMNYITDPVDSCGMLYTGQRKDNQAYGDSVPLWRVAFSAPGAQSLEKEEVYALAQEKCRRYAKRPDMEFDIHRCELYRVHQRCAAQAIKGRVLLVGDALHSNNPAGGFGLTTGIMDAHVIGNVLGRVCKQTAPATRLYEAADDRRQTWLNVTNLLSLGMYKRLRGKDPQDQAERAEYFHKLQTDPEYSHRIRGLVQGIAGKIEVV